MGLWEIIKGEQPGIIKSILNFENLGRFGEFSTGYALTNNNLDGELVILKNIYVPYRDKTSEIDLLMIHEKGIFVFLPKNLQWLDLRQCQPAKLDTIFAKRRETSLL